MENEMNNGRKIIPGLYSLPIPSKDYSFFQKRDVFDRAYHYLVNPDKRESYGTVLIIYGLRRTGKTVLMEQMLSEYGKPEECAYLLVDPDEKSNEIVYMNDIESAIDDAYEKGARIICIDEITKVEDFISHSAVLSDYYSKKGIRFVLTGTDSLGFDLVEEDELMGRTLRVHTTHIPFAEHCRVLNTDDIDDYIQYGGLMKPGANEHYIYDYKSAKKYLDSAVADNIYNSLKKHKYATALCELNREEIICIVNKLVEIYSGKFDRKIAQNELQSSPITCPYYMLIKSDEENIALKKIHNNRRDIVKDYIPEISAETVIKHTITPEMIIRMEEIFRDIGVMSVTIEDVYKYSSIDGWRLAQSEEQYYLIQPAIKYYHLKEAFRMIESSSWFKDLTISQKTLYKDKLQEKIFGDMIEQIVVFDTSVALSSDKYEVSKVKFKKQENNDERSAGEVDMLIWDKQEEKYWGFEIKHTKEIYADQYKDLDNIEIAEVIENYYGKRENVAVLYRGPAGTTPDGVTYLNITDFSKAIHLFRDIKSAMEHLTNNLKPIFPLGLDGLCR